MPSAHPASNSVIETGYISGLIEEAAIDRVVSVGRGGRMRILGISNLRVEREGREDDAASGDDERSEMVAVAIPRRPRLGFFARIFRSAAASARTLSFPTLAVASQVSNQVFNVFSLSLALWTPARAQRFPIALHSPSRIVESPHPSNIRCSKVLKHTEKVSISDSSTADVDRSMNSSSGILSV